MDIQTQKLDLIKWLTEVNDPKLIAKFLKLKDKTISQQDLLITESIERGLNDVKENKTTPHTEVRKKYAKWL